MGWSFLWREQEPNENFTKRMEPYKVKKKEWKKWAEANKDKIAEYNAKKEESKRRERENKLKCLMKNKEKIDKEIASLKKSI